MSEHLATEESVSMKCKYVITPLLLSISLLGLSYYLTWQHMPIAAVATFTLSAIFAAAGKQTADGR